MIDDMYEANVNQAGQAGIGSHAQAMPGDGAGYESLFQILWRGRWLILLSLLLAGGGAYAYWRLATPMYESTARLLVDKPSPQPGSDAPQPAGSTLTNYLATQAGMITSPEIVVAALRDPNVLALPTFSDPNYVKDLLGTLSAEVAKKVDIIQVTASSPYPEDAARIVNAVVRAYVRWHEANRQLTTADLLKDLSSQLDNRYRDLQAKRKEQMLFEQRHPEVLESTPGGMIAKSLEVLRNELVAARLRTVERDSFSQGLQRLEKQPDAFREYVYSHQASTAAASIAATTSAGERSERFRLQMQLENAQFQLQDIQAAGTAQRASQVMMLQNRQSELEKKIADYDTEFVQQQVALAKTLLEDARTQEQKIAEIYDKEFAKVQSLSDQDSQYAFLKSECEMMEKLCNTLLGQINQLDLSARLEGLKIYVLEKAMPAVAPASPQPVRVVGIALVLGLMAGAGLSLLRDWRDQRVRSPDEIAAILGVPILGAIPSVPRRALARGQRLRFAENSRESEACRAIRTALLCGAYRDHTRTILVTSPGPREGKTLLVSNLGMAMAQVGQKTLIVDADLRKPAKQRVFTTNGHGKGLVDVLAGTTGLREAIRSTDIDRLDVLGGGQSTANPSELLTSPAFAAVLQQLKKEYDRVLIDSPPVGVVTDAQVLATLCDATLLVLRPEESSRILTLRARDALLAVGAQVAGAVVNDVSKKDSRYGYYRGYGSYHFSPGLNSPEASSKELPVGTGLRPPNAARTGEKSDKADESVHGSSSADAGLCPEQGTLPIPIKEYDGKVAQEEPLADTDPHVDGGALAAQKKGDGPEAAANGLPASNDTRSAEGASVREKEGDSPLASDKKLPVTAGPARDGSASRQKRSNGGKATGPQCHAEGGPHPGRAPGIPEKKRNGGKATARGPSTDAGAPRQHGASAPGKEKSGNEPSSQGRMAGGGPSPDAADLAAERWKRWLHGER